MITIACLNRMLKNRASRRDQALCGFCKCSHREAESSKLEASRMGSFPLSFELLLLWLAAGCLFFNTLLPHLNRHAQTRFVCMVPQRGCAGPLPNLALEFLSQIRNTQHVMPHGGSPLQLSFYAKWLQFVSNFEVGSGLSGLGGNRF
jgi:hypothetical protein